MNILIRFTLLTTLLTFLAACGVNPVTGKRELQFVSTNDEIGIGQKNYVPARQVQGGDYIVDTEVTLYVQGVMRRLAKVSDRPLPYEIYVINSSVPNAWAMPGGKMAINRGLLVELNSEAELAAVLGHEIVHAAARHGAKSQERGLLLQGGLLATQIGTAGSDNASLIAGGSILGAQLLTTKYGRNAELESDFYGMNYMHRAGYNPSAAVDLQKTFVRLSGNKASDWISGLFASHPPSGERVAKNIATAQQLGGSNLDVGRERYKKAIAPLLRDKPAYDAHDKALKAAKEKNYSSAESFAKKAVALQPNEPQFYGLLGDLSLHKERYQDAISHYERAIGIYPDYFAFHLHKGYAKQGMGDQPGARRAFLRSNEILPTPNAQKALGDLALLAGNEKSALSYFSSAANSKTPIGQQAMLSMAKLELPGKPEKYLVTRLSLNKAGRVVLTVSNRSPLATRDIVVQTSYVDEVGRKLRAGPQLRVRNPIAPGASKSLTTQLTDSTGLRARVVQAKLSK